MNKNTPFHSLLSILILFVLLGCASLPKVKDVVHEPIDAEKPPTIIGSHGPLSPKASKAVIDRLKQKSGSEDLLKLYVSLMEEISGSPLVAGNSVKLLIDGPATYAAMFTAIQDATESYQF